MAEVIVGAVAESIVEGLIERGIQKLGQQASLVLHFKQDFEWLSRQLTFIQAALRDAEQKGSDTNVVRYLMQHLQDITWDAEDILEECAMKVAKIQSIVGELNYRYRMSRKIQGFKERIVSFCEDLKLNPLFREIPQNWSSGSTSQTLSSGFCSQIEAWKKNSTPLDPKPVGMEEKIQKLISFLEGPKTSVIAVIGMGGLGKTLLVQHVFNRIKGNYAISIWLSVSHIFSINKLQRDINSELGIDNFNDPSDQLAAQKIREFLQGKPSLIVLDDVWEASSEASLLHRLGLPCDESSSCKIILTTRNKDVCANLNAVPYEMQLLPEQQSWHLFCRYAFPDTKDNQPPVHLQDVAGKVEKQCAKLPLAIKIVGAAMAGITNKGQWELKLNLLQQRQRGGDPQELVTPILRLSYDCLAPELKPCYLYLSLFPEDEEIDCEYLMNAWIGERLIPKETGGDPLRLARDYLFRLSKLCLVEIKVESFQFCTSVKLHDLLRDLCISISEQNRCLFDVGENFSRLSAENTTPWWRISLPKKNVIFLSENVRFPPALRTLRLSSDWLLDVPTKVFANLKVLRVLDLSGTFIQSLPKSVGNMRLLRVLNLRKTRIDKIPASIRGLKHSLEFLAISHSIPEQILEIPEWVGEFKCMHHLEIGQRSQRLPEAVAKLTSLQTLRVKGIVLSSAKNEIGIEDVARLNRLTELHLEMQQSFDLERLESLVRLRVLSLTNSDKRCESKRCLHNLSGKKMAAMKELEYLCLDGFEVPNWVCELHNLVTLTSYNCDCEEYPPLQTLPELRELLIEGNSICLKLPEEYGQSGAFPKLEVMEIRNFLRLEDLPTFEEGTMKCLRRLSSYNCPALNLKRSYKVPVYLHEH